jgi:AraC-like DNA-binding protein
MWALLKTPGKALDLEAIQAAIVESFLAGQPTLDQVTNVIGISQRTLQRQLADSGLTFTKLVDEARFITARQLIIQGRKLADVSGALGYADAGSFTRAFERWTGMTPQKYRKQFSRSSIAAEKKGGH